MYGSPQTASPALLIVQHAWQVLVQHAIHTHARESDWNALASPSVSRRHEMLRLLHAFTPCAHNACRERFCVPAHLTQLALVGDNCRPAHRATGNTPTTCAGTLTTTPQNIGKASRK